MTLDRGTLLHKRYRIVEILGQGGMGSVYRAVDENLGVDVAVKENLFTTDEYARQFRLEAVILANLRHPNLPRVSDHFVVGEQGQYLIMDFIEGEDLRQRMERIGFISDDDAVMIGAAMCDALTYLHTRKPPILHRDIKPGNVKITPDGHIFLVDFGLAKLVQGGQATTTGARAMTPGYSPPEQYGTARTDARTDVYSLGATLYAALCSMIPEDGLARAMDNAQLTPLRKRNPKVSRRLAATIEKAMAVDPADRFQTAEDFKKALLAAKAKTERATGEFTVVPPPILQGSLSPVDRELPIDPKPKSPPGPLPPPLDEDQPFIPPKKRRRSRSASLLLLLWLFILIGVGVIAFFPGLLPANLRGSLPALFINRPIPTSTITATPDSAPTETAPAATEIAPSPALPSPTGTPFSIAIGTLIPLGTPSETPATSSTPVGGGGGQIAFVSERSGVPQIYLSDLTGDNVVPITNMSDGACQPSWSPDGLRLVFVSPCLRRLDVSEPPQVNTVLYIINVDGTNLTPLPTAPGGDLEPAWSPDGKRIAFTSLRDGHMQIYVMNLDDQTVTRLTNTSEDVDTRQPTWSPFGNQIVYAVKRVEVYQIWAMTDAGQGQQQIARNGQDYWDYLPVWSPDGKVVLFSERYANAPVQPWEESIVYENRETTASQRVKLGPLPNENVRYSPDGLWVVFESKDVDENRDIYYMSLSGGERTRLTKDPSPEFDPAWRPAVSP